MTILIGNQCTDMVLRVESVPAVPYKFLDIGTKMGEYHLEELIPRKGRQEQYLASTPHSVRQSHLSTPFTAALQDRVGSHYGTVQQWCSEKCMV